MNQEIKKLIDNGTIICGRMIKESGIVKFERVKTSQIEGISEEERAFATASMGRAIFTIDKDGKIHNFKGVDSHLDVSELGPVALTNTRIIQYSTNVDAYKVSAIVSNNEKTEIRINGTSPLEDIEIEGDINKKLSKIGVKVPKICYIREMPQDFSIKYGLPIKIAGNLNQFNSDYEVEDNKRKERLCEIYGSNYSQELGENQRPESMKEYLNRIGFLSSPELQTNIELLGYSIEKFIEAVDEYYSRGQRYGQAERIMGSPFRISDLETCIINKNWEQLQTIMSFSKTQNGNFEEQLAEIFGKNIAMLMNNGWECENLIHRQDFSLSGEFCDDSYFDIIEKQEVMKEKYKKSGTLRDEIKRRYTGQVMHIASCIKVIQQAMIINGSIQEEVDGVLQKFVESFTTNLDFEKIGEVFKMDEKNVMEKILEEFKPGQNWIEKMAGQDRKEGFVMDKAIYATHSGNEFFYVKVAEMIVERIEIRANSQGKDGRKDCMEAGRTTILSYMHKSGVEK